MKHEFITKWQKQLSESQRSEFELDVYKYLTKKEPKAQPEPAKHEMTYEEKAKYIIENKLTHKDALVKNCYGYYRDGDIFHFYDDNWKLMFTQRFPTLDLSEWHPFQPKLDRNRFEAMFRAVISRGFCNADEGIKETETCIAKLDAYYASKGNK